ncbi:MAG: cytidylate kinase-like family protein [Sphaerochaetaceae bacterium]|jgi:cytidylate kinase|nr:cytidylate kinase-like family protein [Sphaerochaetaceae bacterium]MDD3940963.1 cytidylate kinase-like family protein [Sphaerochaetaceae bacterium]MDX9939014.1 cytidylate kinase-like family protein [Sphaerochaetaceae bacterium]
MGTKTVITISRQFGSGGREVGRMVAERLDIPFYDSILINMAAEKSGMSKQVLENLDEKAASRFLYTIPTSIPTLGHAATAVYNMPLSDTLFLTEYEIIKQLADSGPCVIVGRCSDYILKDHPDHLSVFIHAPEEARAKRIADYEHIETKEALSRISKYDKERRKYHDYYAAGTWGNAAFYDLTVNSSILGVAGTAGLIVKFVEESGTYAQTT